MNYILRAQHHANRTIHRKRELVLACVVVTVGRVVRVDAEVVRTFLDPLLAVLTKFAVQPWVANVEAPLVSHDVDGKSILRRCATQLEPHTVTPQSQDDENGRRCGCPDQFQAVVAVAIYCLYTFAVTVLDEEDNVRRRDDDEHEEGQPEDDHHQQISLVTALRDSLRGPPEVEVA